MRIRAIVTGRVQGVGFRYYTREEAQSRGITGFVRNLPDGSVEVEAEGKDDAVTAFQQWLNEGPPGASVSSLKVEHIEASGGPNFTILR